VGRGVWAVGRALMGRGACGGCRCAWPYGGGQGCVVKVLSWGALKGRCMKEALQCTVVRRAVCGVSVCWGVREGRVGEDHAVLGHG